MSFGNGSIQKWSHMLLASVSRPIVKDYRPGLKPANDRSQWVIQRVPAL